MNLEHNVEYLEITRNMFLLCCIGYNIIGIGIGVLLTLLAKRKNNERVRCKSIAGKVVRQVK